MKATLRDVARAAAVSVSTASRALNNHAAICPQTLEQVRRVAAELGYQRRRVHRRSGVTEVLTGARIGLVTVGMDRALVALPTVSVAMAGVEAELSEAGARLEVVHLPDPGRLPAGLDIANLDGVILVGAMQGNMARYGQRLWERLGDLPVTWMIGRPGGCPGDAVVSNDFATGAAASVYLAERGHRALALINPKPDHALFCRREDGFIAAARRLDTQVSIYCQAPPGGWSWPLKPPAEIETVQNLVDQLLAETPRPTAIFAVADSVAALVYRALAVRHQKVGQDISVISANYDAALIAGLYPHLTTFDIHQQEIGRLAVQQLATRLAGSGSDHRTELMVQADVVEGESVASLSDGITDELTKKENQS